MSIEVEYELSPTACVDPLPILFGPPYWLHHHHLLLLDKLPHELAPIARVGPLPILFRPAH